MPAATRDSVESGGARSAVWKCFSASFKFRQSPQAAKWASRTASRAAVAASSDVSQQVCPPQPSSPGFERLLLNADP